MCVQGGEPLVLFSPDFDNPVGRAFSFLHLEEYRRIYHTATISSTVTNQQGVGGFCIGYLEKLISNVPITQ